MIENELKLYYDNQDLQKFKKIKYVVIDKVFNLNENYYFYKLIYNYLFGKGK